jgi:tetratricopeptide (TPR) repeat protein
MHCRIALCLTVALTALTALVTLSPAATATEEALGSLDFPTSAGAAAQEHFLRGVLLLHSFEYADAREAFQAAQTAEPDFALAYWGEAMTHNHPLWLRESLEDARAALQKLGPTPEARLAKAPTEREKDFLRAVEILYGEGDKVQRDQAYAEFLGKMAARYPDDLEPASFYALALLGTCHDGRDTATYMKAAAVVEEVFDRNPQHPGAAHYLIHSYDDPVHAPLGLRPARIYADIAPAAEHALHMPSHIFLALGYWDETVASNEDSWRAGEARVAARGLPSDRRNYHALLWLHYAYLQQGRFDHARHLLEVMTGDGRQADASERQRSHLALMRGAFAVDGRGALPPGPDLTDLPPATASATLFATAWRALVGSTSEGATGNPLPLRQEGIATAREALTTLRGILEEAADPKDESGSYRRTVPPSLDEGEIVALQLEGLIHLAAGEEGAALEALGRAVAREESLSFGFGPPVPVKPSRELLAEALLSLDRPEEAREALATALARTPRRARPLSLLATLGGSPEAERAAVAWAAIQQAADTPAPPWLAVTRSMAGDESGIVPAANATPGQETASPGCHQSYRR